MPAHSALPIEWSRYTIKAETVAREITSLTPFQFAGLSLPRVAPDDFAVLADSVKVHGVCEPLTVTRDSRVVDGHARLRAAHEAGIHQVPTRVLEVAGGEEDYALWAAAINLGRRHLTPAQRLSVVRAVLGILEARARERQEATRFGRSGPESSVRGTDADRPDLDSPAPTRDVRTQIGGLLGMSRSQAAKMVALVKDGSDELRAAVADGRMSIHRAHETLRPGPLRPGCERPAGAAADLSHRRDLARDPVRTLRLVAGLIPEWVHDGESWPRATTIQFTQALQNMMDSCELAARRLAKWA